MLRLRRPLTLPVILISAGTAATLTLFLVPDEGDAIRTSCFVVVALTWSYRFVFNQLAQHAPFLKLMRLLVPILAPLLTFALLAAGSLAKLLPLTLEQAAAVCAFGAATTLLLLVAPTRAAWPPVRLAVVGTPEIAADLRHELIAQGITSYFVVGHIEWGDHAVIRPKRGKDPPPLGTSRELAEVVGRDRLDLVLISPTVPRRSFFETVEATCSHADFRILELASFYEQTFGHVALGTINAVWFQWVTHPRYSPRIPAGKRLVDLFVAGTVLAVAAPLIALLALIIRRDGGPAFYRQTRIGEGGRPFKILKLRSMSHTAAVTGPRWSNRDDDRVTPVGQILRRTHLDELPQVINVLHGDMSIVGPRPEQPGFVEKLEDSVPFYSRRHIVRPGITGWAQVRCGYSGSPEGTLWKLSHDLYYLKHRSVVFDFLIMGETVRTLVADSQFTSELYLPPFVQQAVPPNSGGTLERPNNFTPG